MEGIVTGSGGEIGKYIVERIKGVVSVNHEICDLTDWDKVKRLKYDPRYVVNCAFVGKYGKDEVGNVEKNIALILNIRRRWPKAKIISFGSGAMYDKSKPIVKAGEYDLSVYPKDLYGLAKRLIVDLSDVTLIPFGVFGKQRFVEMVMKKVEKNEAVEIFQEALFSWVNLSDLPRVVKWAIKHGDGRYNLCGYNMLLSDLAKKLGAKKIAFLKNGMANEYTGRSNKIKLTPWPSF